MIDLNGKQYSLVLLDTNVLSEFLLAPNEWGPLLVKKYFLNSIIPAFSAFSVVELTSRREVFDKFIDIFSAFPSIMLEGYDSIFRKEIDQYGTGKLPSPTVIAPAFVRAPGMDRIERTKKLFEMADLASKAVHWKSEARAILDDILSLRVNFPPRGQAYTLSEINRFVAIASQQQIELRDESFVKKIKSKSEHIDITQFPSVITTSLIVFYKFYIDKRRPVDSDVFDLIISSVFPYVDAIITEASMRSTISTIQRRHRFLTKINAISLSEARKEIPKYTDLPDDSHAVE